MPSELRVDKVSSTTSPYEPVFSTTGGALSHRNMIINGAIQICQRVQSDGLAQISNATYSSVDRYKFWENTDGTYQAKQKPITDLAGFATSLYLSPNATDTSLAASQYAFFAQLIEAQNLQHIALGTANAKTMTLSFYIKSSFAGGKMTVYVAKYDNGTRIVPIEFDLPSSAGSWERITLTVPALTSGGVINNDNGVGLEVGWYLAAGSTYKVGTSGTWSSNANGYSTANHNVNFMSSTSNYIEVTGVQLELGSVATPYEHRTFDDELRNCQRYYQKMSRVNTAITVPQGTYTYAIGDGCWFQASQVLGFMPYIRKRAIPSISVSSADAIYAYRGGAASTSNTTTCFDIPGLNSARINVSTWNNNGTQGEGSHILINDDEEIFIDAELN